MVAWVPIPFASMEDVVHQEGDSFLVTEEEKINLASIHVQLMQLAEIFSIQHRSVLKTGCSESDAHGPIAFQCDGIIGKDLEGRIDSLSL